ncbi:hypothetical protein SAMN02799624_03150 [Paenibacillus sp. UNC496MF]|uniref:hypothetical protein n=1 Tax=Paenibacillus sp. UNC496MF TaxID=1502753 RepID=UPI0008EB035F|nr:hypothetical protein [Paenibacillus sp. UNC496MF]SFJ04375.1 hypothetical protein SAMN02799624_03150 [Paenibacillus sp. UNC496MF]
MSLAICIFLACCAIIALSLIPKKLTELESLFVFFSGTVFELSGFTIAHINLDWVIVPHGNEPSFANLVMRLIVIPVVLVIASHVLLYDRNGLKWILAAGILLLFTLFQILQEKLGILVTPHWNVYYTLIFFACYIAFARVMAQLILNARPAEEGRS